MADSLHSTSPVGPVAGFSRRDRRAQPESDRRRRGASHDDRDEAQAADHVLVHEADAVARRLLRERVLAATRRELALASAVHVPRFAEAVDRESVALFVGRLVGAQNQLAGLLRPRPQPAELRARLDRALRSAIDETLELLGADASRAASLDAAATVLEVLAEYRRLVAVHPY